MKPLTIACAKGYLWNTALTMLRGIGYSFDDDLSTSRQLSTTDRTNQLTLMCVRPWDVPIYVEEGASDIGIVGKDVLLEQSPNVMELSDLKFGDCRLVIAGPESQKDTYFKHNIRVATKYRQSTIRYFLNHSIRCIPIDMYGAMELAPSTGVADIICDLTATGQTLKENGLIPYDDVFYSTARLISNTTAYMIRYTDVIQIARQLSSQC